MIKKIVIIIIIPVMLMAMTHTSTKPNISSYVYQLQNVDMDQLKQAAFDLAIIDWEDCNCPNGVKELQLQGKKVVSYLSIGEAEDYRQYWQTSWEVQTPSFLEKENPDWPGNFKVKYWQSAWQKIMFETLDQILKEGYDGVYLDIVDGYYYFEEKGRDTARKEMIDFIIKIFHYAKEKNPDFLIIPQNSPELVDDEQYLEVIDGLGKESTWYEAGMSRSKDDIAWQLGSLDKAVKIGKFVLAIDYVTEEKHKQDFITKSHKHNFVPYISNRELDKLGWINGGHN